MSAAKLKAKPKTKDPRQMADEAVQRWFDAMLESADVFMAGGCYFVDLFEEMDAIQNALEAEDGRPVADDDADAHEMSAREAGYLIGVRVGMRLRAARGV